MDIKLIHNDSNLAGALSRVETLWGASLGISEGDELGILSILIEKYEADRYPVPKSDPIEAIKFLMEQQGPTTTDLEPYIGNSGRVSEALNRKQKRSLAMIKRGIDVSLARDQYPRNTAPFA